MDNYILSERLAHAWRTSREKGGKSQDFMARSLGVSKKTVQNWESGFSSPSQLRAFQWFKILDISPLPYFLGVAYPHILQDTIKDDGDIDKALAAVIIDLPPQTKRKLLYLLYGSHGSSVIAMLELITAHLQTPLRDRLNVAQSVYTNYEIAKTKGLIVQPEHIQPDLDLLSLGIAAGKEAIKAGKDTYTIY